MTKNSIGTKPLPDYIGMTISAAPVGWLISSAPKVGLGPEPASLQAALRDWKTVYNTTRPYKALGYLTPAGFLATVGVDV